MWNLIPAGIINTKDDSAVCQEVLSESLRNCMQWSENLVSLSPSSPAVSAYRRPPHFPPVKTNSTMAGTGWRWKRGFFFKIILGVSCYLEAEIEAHVRIAALRTVTVPGWIYNSHFNWCQEDTELPVSNFSTAVNRLGWTSGMFFAFVIYQPQQSFESLQFYPQGVAMPIFIGWFYLKLSVFWTGKA